MNSILETEKVTQLNLLRQENVKVVHVTVRDHEGLGGTAQQELNLHKRLLFVHKQQKRPLMIIIIIIMIMMMVIIIMIISIIMMMNNDE